MELNTQEQTVAFIWAFLLGIVIVLIYIILETIRIIVSASKLRLFIGDMLFVFSVFLINFLYAVSMTQGKLRMYVVLAELISFTLIYILWRHTLKRLIIALIDRINKKILRPMHTFGKNTLESMSAHEKINIFYKKKKNP